MVRAAELLTSRSRRGEPLGVARGLAAGVIGTAVMTAWQELSIRWQSSDPNAGNEGETEQGGQRQQQDPWQQAPAPAKVARKLLEAVFGQRVPPEKIGLLTNVMHWGYGTGWGALYGLIQGTIPAPGLRRGLLFGTGVWAMSYVTLVPMGLYQPPWKYSPKELAMDLSHHLAYGAGVGASYAAIQRQAE